MRTYKERVRRPPPVEASSGALACVMAVLLWVTPLSNAEQLRGIWVDAFGPGFLDRSQVQQLASDCRKYNFNAVFVQMRKRGDAFYLPKAPNGDPRAVEIEPDFDALAEIIKECHGKEPRIQVHCWVVAYLVWAWDKPPSQKAHIYNQHPEYLTRDCIGQRFIAKGYYLDPGHPEVGTTLHDLAKDIITRYDVDGLHWDYLRYPERDSGYNETALARYKAEFSCSEDPKSTDPRFCDWRRRQVTDFLRWSSAELLAQKPELIISTAAFSNYPDSRDNRFADWVAWNREGILDVCVPMDFSPDNKFVFEPRARFAFSNQCARAVWLGQASYMNTREGTLKQLRICEEQGFGGTVLYCYRKPADGIAVVSPNGLNNSSESETAGRTQVTVDNDQAQKQGEWKSGAFGKPWGKDYLSTPKGNGQNSARFVASLPEPGTYSVCEWHVAGVNRAADASYLIIHKGGTNLVRVNQQINGTRWNSLGSFDFDTNAEAVVEITDYFQSSGDVVVADAIRFVLVPAGKNDAGLSHSKASRTRVRQESVFAFLKTNCRPEWELAPVLPWKQTKSKAILRGIVSTGDGEPVYNATVQISDETGQKQLTEPHGRFAFFELRPGNYRVKAMYESRKAEQTVELKPGQNVALKLRLGNSP